MDLFTRNKNTMQAIFTQSSQGRWMQSATFLGFRSFPEIDLNFLQHGNRPIGGFVTHPF